MKRAALQKVCGFKSIPKQRQNKEGVLLYWGAFIGGYKNSKIKTVRRDGFYSNYSSDFLFFALINSGITANINAAASAPARKMAGAGM